MVERRGRPKVPIISRQRVIDAALEIIDNEGLEALTTRHLAEALGVKGASLYNHFKNKDEILLAAAEYAVGRMPRALPEGPPNVVLHWGAQQLRKALMRHPNLVPVVAQQHATGLGWSLLDSITRYIVTMGYDLRSIMSAYECCERFVIGTVIRDISVARTGSHRMVPSEDYPFLARAMEESPMSADEQFDTAIVGILNAILPEGSSRPLFLAPRPSVEADLGY